MVSLFRDEYEGWQIVIQTIAATHESLPGITRKSYGYRASASKGGRQLVASQDRGLESEIAAIQHARHAFRLKINGT
jgi:hypothetical protein